MVDFNILSAQNNVKLDKKDDITYDKNNAIHWEKHLINMISYTTQSVRKITCLLSLPQKMNTLAFQ